MRPLRTFNTRRSFPRHARMAKPNRCNHPRRWRMFSFGLAGCGFGSYQICLKCSTMLSKELMRDDES